VVRGGWCGGAGGAYGCVGDDGRLSDSLNKVRGGATDGASIGSTLEVDLGFSDGVEEDAGPTLGDKLGGRAAAVARGGSHGSLCVGLCVRRGFYLCSGEPVDSEGSVAICTSGADRARRPVAAQSERMCSDRKCSAHVTKERPYGHMRGYGIDGR